ncbi:MAG: dihydrolipoyl dehydrogenase [Firmicutes bacterium HGW-Firmicutes-16]|nr:MAG: dihydrolipoyl dehydrogenase [Firmicutes bacterium HGW-Firmicutes-16]
MSQKYDLVVIGAGPGGYTAAIAAAQHGMKTAVVESRDIGGTCLNRGCIPAKTMLHSAELYREMQDSASLGIYAENTSYDMEAIYHRKDEVVSGVRDGIESLIKANKIDFFYGTAKILSAEEVFVSGSDEETILNTAKIIIATGAIPSRPPIEGIDLVGVITSDELLESRAVDYKSLIIIGGGVIGAEFASVFNALGCAVTIIEALERIVPTLDREISQNLTMILKKRGVAIHTGCSVERIAETDSGLCCRFTGKNGAQELAAQGVLVSTGRKPNFSGLFGEGVNVNIQRGIVVDEHFKTSVESIYAIGDVIDGSIQLAHAASAQAQNVIAYITGDTPPIDLSVVPSCVYTSPEIASVGITAEQAKSSGIEVKTGKYAMSGNAKTIIEQQDRSFIKLIFDAETEVLLGTQMMCARASDLVSELSSAIVNKLTVKQLSAVIRPHPTFTEAVTEAVEDVEGRAIHTMPTPKR